MARDLCCVKAVKQCSINCQELWFFYFFSSLQTYRLSTHCMEVNGSSVEQSQVQSRADSEPRATVCKHTVALVLPMETWLGQLGGEEWDGVMASAVPD